jgi:hypothetical protein
VFPQGEHALLVFSRVIHAFGDSTFGDHALDQHGLGWNREAIRKAMKLIVNQTLQRDDRKSSCLRLFYRADSPAPDRVAIPVRPDPL